MTLTALAIEINNKQRIVGKVGRMPYYELVPTLQGKIALYKEELIANCVSYKLQAIGVDSEAWDVAAGMGAVGMVIWCKDVDVLFVINKSIINGCKKVDLSEGVQIRVPLQQCRKFINAPKIDLGWTNVVIKIKAETYGQSDSLI